VADRYAIERLIARGGMGEVYLARDELLRREVAIKVNRASGEEKVVERFTREAHLAARFDHPNIVRIFDLGRTADGSPFLVMELLRGDRFADLLKQRGSLDLPEVVELLDGIAGALDLIHREGIVHRDLKLDNLMLVEREDGTLRPTLLDFGVALAAMDEGPRLTIDGAIVGTPLYCAPEVLLGATPASSADVYSLAVVAYQLLTGSAPFDALESQRMMHAKVSEDAPPPSSLRPQLSPAVDAVFASALSRDPDLRPATASELIAKLAETLAPPPAPRRWLTDRFYYAAGIASFVLAGLVLLKARAN
jgi:serine/threonine-protein kinase